MAYATKIYKYNTLDVNKVGYTGIKTLKSNAAVKYISPRVGDELGITLQTPVLLTTTGFSSYVDAATGKVTHTISASFPFADAWGNSDYEGAPGDENYEQGMFYNTIRNLERKFIADGAKNSLEWFKKGKVYTEEQVKDDKYTTMIKLSADKESKELNGKYPPSFKVKVQFGAGDNNVRLYDNDKNPVEASEDNFREYIPKGTRFSAIISMTGLWLAGGKLSPSWKVLQLRVHSAKAKGLAEYAFVDDGEEAIGASQPAPASNAFAITAAPQSSFVDDDDAIGGGYGGGAPEEPVRNEDADDEDEETTTIEVEVAKPKAAAAKSTTTRSTAKKTTKA